MKILRDDDASLTPLEGRTVAVLGYGNQGRSQALNLRDSGVAVIVGNRDDAYLERARADGFAASSIGEAARAADVLMILTTDESQPLIWEREIVPRIAAGDLLVWASGYNVGYGLIVPPVDVDVVAPRMPGSEVRTFFERGAGALAAVAVHQDVSGRAWELMMAIAKGIGAARGGVYESPFREEAELDLFAEQVVWPGISTWIEQCFALGVEHGFPPELLVLDVYGSGETTEIFDLIAKEGYFKQLKHHSTTAQYGNLSRAEHMRSDELLEKGRELLVRDIKGGAFAREWSDEQSDGAAKLERLWREALESPMAQAEEKVLPLVQRLRQGER